MKTIRIVLIDDEDGGIERQQEFGVIDTHLARMLFEQALYAVTGDEDCQPIIITTQADSGAGEG